MIPAALLVACCLVADRPAATFGGHPLRVGDATVAVSANGNHVVTFSPSGDLRTFDAATGRELAREIVDHSLRSLTGPPRPLLSLAGTAAALVDPAAGELVVRRPPRFDWAAHSERPNCRPSRRVVR